MRKKGGRGGLSASARQSSFSSRAPNQAHLPLSSSVPPKLPWRDGRTRGGGHNDDLQARSDRQGVILVAAWARIRLEVDRQLLQIQALQRITQNRRPNVLSKRRIMSVACRDFKGDARASKRRSTRKGTKQLSGAGACGSRHLDCAALSKALPRLALDKPAKHPVRHRCPRQ